MKKILLTLICLLISAVSPAAQQTIVPIVEMRSKSLLGGVQNGKWIKAEQVAPVLKDETEMVLVGWNGVEEGGVTVGEKAEQWGACPEIIHFKFDLDTDEGVAIGSGAKWNPAPRIARKISLTDKTYMKIVADFLKTKGIAAPVVKITQAFRVDLEKDGQDEVILSATYAKTELISEPKKGDYSFVLLRKIVGGKARNILLAGDFITTNNYQDTATVSNVSAIADLNGDGKMEIVVSGIYYEGDRTSVFEINGAKAVKVLETECYV